MTDLTDNAGGLHRAKPRGANSHFFGDRQRLAPILLVLAGRSLAAILVLSRLALAAVAHQANPDAGGVRRREPRSGEVFAACHLWARPVSSGLASFRPSERNDSVRAAVRGSEVERSESW